MGSSRGPEGVFADGSRGLKPIPEDALRPSMEASNGAGGAPNAAARPGETVSLSLVLTELPHPVMTGSTFQMAGTVPGVSGRQTWSP